MRRHLIRVLRVIGVLGLLGAVPGLISLWRVGWPLVEDEARTAVLVMAAAAQLLPVEELERRIEAALAAEDIDLAGSYLALADGMGREIRPEVRQNFQNATSGWATAKRTAKECAAGVMTGEANSGIGLGCTIALDLTAIGDFADLGRQMKAYSEDTEVDQVAVALSGVGIAFTVGALVTTGAAAPAKAGISVLKTARKTGRLSAKYMDDVARQLNRAIDVDRMRTEWRLLDKPSLEGAQEIVRRSTDAGALRRVAGQFQSLALVAKAAGPGQAMRMLKHVESGEDLVRLERLAAREGKRSLAIVETVGPKALRIVGKTLKWTAELVWMAVGLLTSMLNFVLSLVLKRAARAVRTRLEAGLEPVAPRSV